MRSIDKLLRNAFCVKPFTEEQACILRIANAKSKRQIQFSDRTDIKIGDPILTLHDWNERILSESSEVESLSWGRSMFQRFQASLRMLMACLEEHPELDQLQSF